jgi:acyl-[acyl-carrier-protein] desaturase
MATPEQLNPAELPEKMPDELAAMGLPTALSRHSIDHEADQAVLKGVSSVDDLYNQHLKASTIWYPHLMVSHDKDWGTPFDLEAKGKLREGQRVWTPEDSPLPEPVRVAFEVGLWTEDNLPEYFSLVMDYFGSNPAMAAWNRRWMAEEGRHSDVMTDYLRGLYLDDPVLLQDGRFQNMTSGDVPSPYSIVDAIAYVTFQEKATRISHQNSGLLLEQTAEYSDDKQFPLDETGTGLADVNPETWERRQELEREERAELVRATGKAIMTRVAQDESLHYRFYAGLMDEVIQTAPSMALNAILRQIVVFGMPGQGIDDFKQRARTIADTGIYDLRLHHDDIVEGVALKRWKVHEIEQAKLDDEAKAAQEFLVETVIPGLDKMATRFVEKRDARRAADPDAIYLGKAA